MNPSSLVIYRETEIARALSGNRWATSERSEGIAATLKHHGLRIKTPKGPFTIHEDGMITIPNFPTLSQDVAAAVQKRLEADPLKHLYFKQGVDKKITPELFQRVVEEISASLPGIMEKHLETLLQKEQKLTLWQELHEPIFQKLTLSIETQTYLPDKQRWLSKVEGYLGKFYVDFLRKVIAEIKKAAYPYFTETNQDFLTALVTNQLTPEDIQYFITDEHVTKSLHPVNNQKAVSAWILNVLTGIPTQQKDRIPVPYREYFKEEFTFLDEFARCQKNMGKAPCQKAWKTRLEAVKAIIFYPTPEDKELIELALKAPETLNEKTPGQEDPKKEGAEVGMISS